MKNLRFLVVDDFAMIRSMLKTTLYDLGYKDVEEAKDGVEAYTRIAQAYLDKKPFSLVFLDWNMPNMNGLQLIQKCYMQAELKSLPFVMITAEQEAQKVKQALVAGARDFVVKPFTPAVIKRKIESIMSVGKAG